MAAALVIWAVCEAAGVRAQGPAGNETAIISLPPALQQGRALLKAQQFAEARTVFATYLAAHPGAVQAELGLGDAQVGLHQLEAAELTYRGAVATEPELWQGHKNLVLVEAKLGRWEEFDRERTLLRMARERHAPGITAGESDLIDSFDAGCGHWLARAYFEPVGRSQALYNFERFSPVGRIEAYVSLEDAAAARAALVPGDVRIGAAPSGAGADVSQKPLALNWYTGSSHGTIRTYNDEVPSYEELRRTMLRWLKQAPGLTQKSAAGAASEHRTEEKLPGFQGKP